MGELLMKIKKEENDISINIIKLKNIIEDDPEGYLESKEFLEEIHSIAWNIQVKAERMLKFIDGK